MKGCLTLAGYLASNKLMTDSGLRRAAQRAGLIVKKVRGADAGEAYVLYWRTRSGWAELRPRGGVSMREACEEVRARL